MEVTHSLIIFIDHEGPAAKKCPALVATSMTAALSRLHRSQGTLRAPAHFRRGQCIKITNLCDKKVSNFHNHFCRIWSEKVDFLSTADWRNIFWVFIIPATNCHVHQRILCTHSQRRTLQDTQQQHSLPWRTTADTSTLCSSASRRRTMVAVRLPGTPVKGAAAMMSRGFPLPRGAALHSSLRPLRCSWSFR
jgi:hypothetical protein